jgi:hypothetical protein
MQLRANPSTQNFPAKTCARFCGPHRSARREMKQPNGSKNEFLLSCLPYESTRSDRNSVLSKNISACTGVHLHAPTCTDVHRFTVPEKRVRRYSVRTALCSATKMNAQSTNAMEGASSASPLTLVRRHLLARFGDKSCQ